LTVKAEERRGGENNQIDREMNQMVYKPYELTEEEIEIVEKA